MGWRHLSIPTLYRAYDYLSMLGLKLNHVSKRGYWCLHARASTAMILITDQNLISFHLHPFQFSSCLRVKHDFYEINYECRNSSTTTNIFNNTKIFYSLKKKNHPFPVILLYTISGIKWIVDANHLCCQHCCCWCPCAKAPSHQHPQ